LRELPYFFGMKASAFFFCFLLLAGCTDESSAPTEKKDTAVRKPATVRQAPNRLSPVDVSPLDISYFPVDYPLARMSGRTTAPPLARVIYSRPHRQGRVIFGNLLQYGHAWRLGANEATELELFRDASVNGKRVAKGRYMIYCVPQADHWTIVFNANLYSWGLTQNAKQDILRVDIPVTRNHPVLEYYTMVFEKTDTGAQLLMAWEDVQARLPMTFY
jgi:hypothetical protein